MPSVRCKIRGEGGEGRFTIIRCLDPALSEYFFDVVGSLLISSGERGTTLSSDLMALVELFRLATNRQSKSFLGLWSELLLIAESEDCESMLSGWHVHPVNTYDFSWGDNHLEVKATGSQIRAHPFSLAQLCPPKDTPSMFVQYKRPRRGMEQQSRIL